MKKIFVSILLVSSFLCFSQHTKKRTHKKVYKKTFVKKKTPIVETAEVPIEEKTETVDAPPPTHNFTPESRKLEAADNEQIVTKPLIVEKPQYEKTAEKLIKQKGWIHNRNSAISNGVELFAKGFFVSDGKIFVLLEITNRTNINYDISDVNFSIVPVDEKNYDFGKDENKLSPIYDIHPEKVEKKSKQKMVYVFDKFTFNSEKTINIKISESKGERNLNLKINPKFIIKSKYIN